jgi:hypothetical protein
MAYIKAYSPVLAESWSVLTAISIAKSLRKKFINPWQAGQSSRSNHALGAESEENRLPWCWQPLQPSCFRVETWWDPESSRRATRIGLLALSMPSPMDAREHYWWLGWWTPHRESKLRAHRDWDRVPYFQCFLECFSFQHWSAKNNNRYSGKTSN